MKQSHDPITQGHSPTCPLFPVTIQKQNKGPSPGERGKW